MKKRKFLVPRQATDAAAGSGAKPQAAGQANAEAAPAAAPEKRSKAALQLVRPGGPAIANSLVRLAPKKDSHKTAPEPTVQAKEAKALLLEKNLPRSVGAADAPPPQAAPTSKEAAAPAPAGAHRRTFRIPTLPPDALPSLAALLLYDTSVCSSLADTLRKASLRDTETASIFPELASFDSEALAQAAVEMLDRILPSYYEDQDIHKKNHHALDTCSYPQGGALRGVIFALSSSGKKNLRKYCQMDPIQLQEMHLQSSSKMVSLPAAAAAPKKAVLFEAANITSPLPKFTSKVQFSTLSDCGASILSSAVWVPTPGGDGKEEKHLFSEATLRRRLAEDAEIPLSFLKSLF